MTLQYKAILLASTALFSMNIGFAQKRPTGISISGKINGTDTGMVYLVNPADQTTDSVQLKNGRFSFSGCPAVSMAYALRLRGVRPQAMFFSDKKAITVIAHKDSLNNARVYGSELNASYKEFDKVWSVIHNKAGVYHRRSDSLYKAFNSSIDSATRDQLSQEYQQLGTFANHLQDSFIRKHANSPVGAYIIDIRYAAYNQNDKVSEMYNVLGPVAKSSYYGKKIKSALDIAAKTGIGVSPTFAQTDTAGKIVKLSDFKGKYVLVDFWASWCGPCRKENPNLVAAYNKFHNKGFDILGISLDDKKQAWLDAIHKDGLTWSHVSDLKGWNNAIAADLGVKIVPTSFLVDPNGKIVAKDLRGEALHKKLEELLQ